MVLKCILFTLQDSIFDQKRAWKSRIWDSYGQQLTGESHSASGRCLGIVQANTLEKINPPLFR